MYKPSTYSVVTYFLTYLPIYVTYFLTYLPVEVTYFLTYLPIYVTYFLNINSVEVHPQLSNNGHPVDGALVGAGSLWPNQTRYILLRRLH